MASGLRNSHESRYGFCFDAVFGLDHGRRATKVAPSAPRVLESFMNILRIGELETVVEWKPARPPNGPFYLTLASSNGIHAYLLISQW